MADVNYDDHVSQMDQLRDYINEYCAENNIDPATYVSALDGEIDVDLQSDPAFQAYWNLAYLQLIYLLSGGAPQVSGDGDVTYDYDAMMAAYNDNPDLHDLAFSILQDDPEMMAFFAQQTGDAASTGDYSDANSLLAAIQLSQASIAAEAGASEDSDDEEYVYTDEQARDFVEAYGSSEGLDWLIEYEEGVRAAEGSILSQLAEMDQQLVELTEALNNGTMSAEEFSAEAENISAYRSALLAMLQQLQDSLSTVMEMYSKLVEQATEMSMSVVNNMRPV